MYQFILQWKRAHDGAPPSYRRMAAQFDPPLSLSIVYYHIQHLIGMGLLKKVDGDLCTNGEWMQCEK